MRHTRLYVSVAIFGGIAVVFFGMLAFITVRNAIRDKALIMQNALTEGYWITRSVEIGQSMMRREHANTLRDLIQHIEAQPAIRFLIVLDANQRVLIASNTTLEGTTWPGKLGHPPETGRMVKNDAGVIDLVFPASFAARFQMMPHRGNSIMGNARWIVLELDASEEQAHYRDIVMQSIFVSVSMVILGFAAFVFFGMIQKYKLANASIEQLENIKRHLARFVPGTVQKLIEENPQRPSLNKVEREATVLFLDIDHYTQISQDMSPEALNRLMEIYFAAFLDIILGHGGEINETAGDGIMAIFTGKTPRAHALNAVRAAVGIRNRARQLNRERARQRPEIQVNLGLNTGRVLLGATMIKGATGERFTYTATGMVTNVASRLCDLGNKGAIHLSDATARLVLDYFELLGPHEVHLKHVQRPVVVYELA